MKSTTLAVLVLVTFGASCDSSAPPVSDVRVRLAVDPHPLTGLALNDYVCDVTVRADDGAVAGPLRVSATHHAEVLDYGTTFRASLNGGQVARLEGLVYRVPCPRGHDGEEVTVELTVVGVYETPVAEVGEAGSPRPDGPWLLYPMDAVEVRAICGADPPRARVELPELTFGEPGEVTVELLAHLFDVANDPPVWLLGPEDAEDPPELPAVAVDRDTVEQRVTFACVKPTPELSDPPWSVWAGARFAPPEERPDAHPLGSLPGFTLGTYKDCGDVEVAGPLAVTPALWASDDPTDGRVRFGTLRCAPDYACDPPTDAADALRDGDGRALPTATVSLRCEDLDPDAVGPPKLYFDPVEVICEAPYGTGAGARISDPAADGLLCPLAGGPCDEALDHWRSETSLIRQAAVERVADGPRASLWRVRLGLSPEELYDRRCAVEATASAVPAGQESLASHLHKGRYPLIRWSMSVGGLGEEPCGPELGVAWETAPEWGLWVKYDGSTRPGGDFIYRTGLPYHFSPEAQR